MHHSRSLSVAVAVGLTVVVANLTTPRTADAQAGGYPAFQPPWLVEREFNFAVADGDVGTSLVFQWRESWSPVSQLNFDAGFSDPGGAGDARVLLGVGYARQLNRATNEMPLDLMFTLGGYISFADPVIFQVPVGVVLGHRFPLEGELAITPYVHPRAALQYVSDRGDDESETDLGIAFDIGADFEVTRQLSLRFAIAFGDDLNESIGLGVAWRPMGLRRR